MKNLRVIVVFATIILVAGCADRSEGQLFRDIRDAQKLLSHKRAGYDLKWVTYHDGKPNRSQKTWKVRRLKDYNVLLAIQAKGGGPIDIIRLADKGTKAPRGYSVSFPRKNGVNTEYRVRGYAVLALRRVVRIGDQYQEVVYTPYTRDIDTPFMRERGMQYLRDMIARAEKKLRMKKVKSRAFPGRLVSDVVPRRVSLTLSIIEHIDHSRFFKRGAEATMNEVLVTIAANGSKAYNYSVSKAGARALFQFIPSTYRTIYARYPEAELIKDFVKGMEDHLNGAMASLLLFDNDLRILSKKHLTFLSKHPLAMGKYLTAAYNGGPSRAKRAILKYRGKWESHVLTETRVYLKKFNAIYPLVSKE